MTPFALFLMIGTQSVPAVQVPPAPPLPNAGEIHCTLRSEDGGFLKLDGLLSLSEPRAGGRRFPQVVFKSGDSPEMSGTFSANWEIGGGRFLNVSASGDVITEMILVTPTYAAGRGAIAVEVSSFGARTKRYFSGFCEHSLSYKSGINSQ